MSRPYHIVHISNLYPPIVVGGAEVVCKDLAEAAVRDGHRVTVISTNSARAIQEGDGVREDIAGTPVLREERSGVHVVRFFPKNLYWIREQGNPSALKKALWHARDGWNSHAAQVVDALLEELQPDLVHTHNIDGFSPAVWAVVRKRGIPIVHTCHDLHLVCPRATLIRRDGSICEAAPAPCQLYRGWYSLRTRDVSRFCSPSAFLLEKHKEYGSRPQRAEVVRNGVPMPHLEEMTARPARREDGTFRFFFMGQLGSHKGIDTLLDAWEAMGAREGLRLDVAGVGPLEGRVRSLAERDARVTYHGFVRGDQKEQLLSSADAFVIASTYYDNAPLSIIEAYSYGLPVLASRIGGLPEMVRDGETGILFEPGNVASLVGALERTAADRDEHHRMRRAALNEAREYSVDAMYARYARVYAEEVGAAQTIG